MMMVMTVVTLSFERTVARTNSSRASGISGWNTSSTVEDVVSLVLQVRTIDEGIAQHVVW